MLDPNKAFEVSDGFIIEGGPGFFSAPTLPTGDISNYPEGSLFLLSNGKQYVKSGSKWALNRSGVGIKKVGVGESIIIEDNEESVLTRNIFIRGSLILKGRLTIL
jgi:hypothetical protein